MHTILVAHSNVMVSDLLRLALRNVPGLRGLAVPVDHVESVIRGRPESAGLLLEHDGPRDDSTAALVSRLLAVAPDLRIVLVGEKSTKMVRTGSAEPGIFANVALPLDLIDLSRRLHRLAKSLEMVTSGSRRR